MSDLEVNGIKYRVAKMNVFDQAHVARKIAPVVFGLGRGYASAMGKLQPLAQMQQDEQEKLKPDPPNGAANGADGNGLDYHEGENPEPVPIEIDPAIAAQQNEIMLDAMSPLADILAKMDEQDVDYVLKKCLSVVSRHNGQHYVPLMRSGNMMFDDLDLSALIQLTMEVVQDNLGPSLLAILPLGLAAGGAQSPSAS